jgi:hypothetical protein
MTWPDRLSWGVLLFRECVSRYLYIEWVSFAASAARTSWQVRLPKLQALSSTRLTLD